jgi:hypothetical protein
MMFEAIGVTLMVTSNATSASASTRIALHRCAHRVHRADSSLLELHVQAIVGVFPAIWPQASLIVPMIITR